MPETPHPEEGRAVRDKFLQLNVADLEREQLRRLEEYQALFPGFESDIAEEFDALDEGGFESLAALEQTVTTPAPEPSEDAKFIGPYRILRTLGEGGMGRVYLAEQREPVQRKVALKLIKLGMDSEAVVHRFEQERQALALMDHEGIAKVYDCGTTDRGQPFFVMELVKGIPLDQFCEQQQLSLQERLLLMSQVCAAVQHAHQKGVVHRDLKPGNVLVSDDDGRLQVKIIDFGLAKAMGQKLVEATLFTEAGQIVGTPEYMAPEQADPTNLDIDTRADIYSLGVMLYQVLVGELPFPSRELREKGMLEVQRILREVEPPKPSTRLTTMGDASARLARTRRVSVSALRRALKSDLDWVVLKALEKNRNRRYDTANALSADLHRFLDHEPLVAGPPSAGYRLKKLVRRYRGQFVAASLVLVALISGGVGTFVQYLRAEEKAEDERVAKIDAQTNLKKYEAKAAEFNQLAVVVKYRLAIANAERLYPAWPHKIDAMQKWLDEDCEPLLAMRGQIERTANRLRDGRSASELPSELPPDHPDRQAEEFLHDTLVELLDDLASLAEDEKARVEGRLSWARQIAGLTLAHPGARHTWGKVREAIAASDKYAGKTIEPIELRDEDVLGLVPIGANPVTGLWEFFELRSAWDGKRDPQQIPIPLHEPDGSIEMTGETGIVFVLLPGGAVTLGSQSDDADAPFYDPRRRGTVEGKAQDLHTVSLWPFFLARHELTQGQWKRMTGGEEPSDHVFPTSNTGNPDAIAYAHPVESVDWPACETWLTRHGLVLPTEAQWEYGCRGGTTTPWIVEFATLELFANVSDSTAKAAGKLWKTEDWTDGYFRHAPVGSFAANGFGLHDVHGNVWEWCRDMVGPYGGERKGDGLRPGGSRDYRMYRGGSFNGPAAMARSAQRNFGAPGSRMGRLGVRPARSLRQ